MPSRIVSVVLLYPFMIDDIQKLTRLHHHRAYYLFVPTIATVKMEQRLRTHSEMIQHFVHMLALLVHIVLREQDRMKCERILLDLHNPVTQASSARQRQHLQKVRVLVHLHLSAQKEQLTLDLLPRGSMLNTLALLSPQHVYLDSTHQQSKLTNVMSAP